MEIFASEKITSCISKLPPQVPLGHIDRQAIFKDEILDCRTKLPDYMSRHSLPAKGVISFAFPFEL